MKKLDKRDEKLFPYKSYSGNRSIKSLFLYQKQSECFTFLERYWSVCLKPQKRDGSVSLEAEKKGEPGLRDERPRSV